MLRLLKQLVTGLTGLLCGMILVYGLINTGVAQAQVTECDLINNQEQMFVFFAPIDAPSQIRDILLEGESYRNIGFANGFFHIEYGDSQRGWVRFHTRVLNGACTVYLENPSESIPIEQFPTLCLFTTNSTLVGYSDPLFKQVHPGFGEVSPDTYCKI